MAATFTPHTASASPITDSNIASSRSAVLGSPDESWTRSVCTFDIFQFSRTLESDLMLTHLLLYGHQECVEMMVINCTPAITLDCGTAPLFD